MAEPGAAGRGGDLSAVRGATAPDGTLRAEEFLDTGWSISEVKDRAREWLRELPADEG